MPKHVSDTKVVVHPVAGSYMRGVPNADLEVDSEVAARLVRTGAFTFDGTSIGDAQMYEPGAELDFYDSPIPHGQHYKRVAETTPEATAEAVKPEE